MSDSAAFTHGFIWKSGLSGKAFLVEVSIWSRNMSVIFVGWVVQCLNSPCSLYFQKLYCSLVTSTGYAREGEAEHMALFDAGHCGLVSFFLCQDKELLLHK